MLLAAAALYVSYRSSLLGMGLSVLLIAVALITLVVTVVRLARRRAYAGWLSDPFGPGERRFTGQFMLRAVLWLGTAYAATLGFPRALTSPGEATISYALIWTAAVLLVLSGLAPGRRVNAVNVVAAGLAVMALGFQLVQLHLPAPAPVRLAAPVEGTWMVGSGGRSGLVSHHATVAQQRDALDLSVPFPRHSSRPPTELSDYPAYGQPVSAPADGTVVRISNGQPDQPIGHRDLADPVGNHLVLDIGGGRFVLVAHLKPGSISVTEGQRVRSGEQLAAVGNSGYSSEPHLHLQVQSGPDLMTKSGQPTPGLITYPIAFENAERTRTGTTTPTAHDLRTNDLVTFS